MHQILVGTQNADKLREIQQILDKFAIQAVSLEQFGPFPEVEETGSTYEENAILKATFFSNATRLPCISDDSGLEVEALGGQPGVHSNRYSGATGADRYPANNRQLLQALENIPWDSRGAKFVSVMVLVWGGKLLLSCRGECAGKITFSPRGTAGFGYDPVFEVLEYQKTFGELGAAAKNKISHRAKALALFSEKFAAIRDSLFVEKSMPS